MKRILIACEFSGTVRDAFTRRGYDATSCDLLPTETPGKHYQGNVLDIINDGWDLMIAHPPCTYMSKAGARWMYKKAGIIDEQRFELAMKAREFFIKMLNAPISRIAVENPTPLKVVYLPTPTQAIQPFEFGHPYSKKTLLWLKNLPKLQSTQVVFNHDPYLPSNTGGASRGQKHHRGTSTNWKQSSKTFKGIADAMADQWGRIL
jgi:hypothetical protein